MDSLLLKLINEKVAPNERAPYLKELYENHVMLILKKYESIKVNMQQAPDSKFDQERYEEVETICDLAERLIDAIESWG